MSKPAGRRFVLIPVSHLLSGFVVGRFARVRLQARGGAKVRPWRDPLVAGAIAASVFPDWDIVPGLTAGYPWVKFHRGPTHSPVGVVLQALAMTPVGLAAWRRLRGLLPGLELAPAPSWGALFGVLLAGMGLHALLDALNPWGVAALWPLGRRGATWNLVHEGDLGFAALTAACGALALVGSARTIALATVLSVAGFLTWQTGRRGEARQAAATALGAGAEVFPAPGRGCPWTALAREGNILRAACVAPGGGVQAVSTVRSSESPLAEASMADPVVEKFLENRSFAYAEEGRDAEGGTVILWRDLREALLEGPDDPRFGLEVRFGPDGRVVSVEHRWLLKMAF